MRFSILRGSLHAIDIPRRLPVFRGGGAQVSKTYFHTTPSWGLIKPYLLADIGEGELCK
jgi:hypothetical protein